MEQNDWRAPGRGLAHSDLVQGRSNESVDVLHRHASSSRRSILRFSVSADKTARTSLSAPTTPAGCWPRLQHRQWPHNNAPAEAHEIAAPFKRQVTGIRHRQGWGPAGAACVAED